jgi:hypothetical protein
MVARSLDLALKPAGILGQVTAHHLLYRRFVAGLAASSSPRPDPGNQGVTESPLKGLDSGAGEVPRGRRRITCRAVGSDVVERVVQKRRKHNSMPRAGGPRAVKRNLSLWSKRDFDAIDGRLLEAREEKRLIKALTEHVGGRPSVTQEILIKRTARSVIMLEVLERRVLETKDFGDLQARQMIALTNSARLNLMALGLKAAEAPKTLASYIKAA